jgi:hypothetical protein
MLILVTLLSSPVAAAAGPAEPAGNVHGKDFWRAVVAADYALPEDESTMALLKELSGLLGSPDPEERDEFGYGIVVRWIYVQKLLSPQELHELREIWTGNLRRGIGETGTDSVLRRSFSALDLSILAALDNESPWLGEAGFRDLLGAALRYLREEQDVRGHVPDKGWLHSPAHTADLIKFLGRSRHLKRGDQSRILDAVAAKMDAPGEVVYRHDEDERMARAVLSILRREDLDREAVQAWLKTLAGMSDGLWDGPHDPRRHAAVQNAKNLLKSLYVLLSVEKDGEAPEALQVIRGRVLQAITALQ